MHTKQTTFQSNDRLIFVGVLERYDTLRSWGIIRDLRVWFIREQAYKSAPPELRVADRCISIASSFTNKKKWSRIFEQGEREQESCKRRSGVGGVAADAALRIIARSLGAHRIQAHGGNSNRNK
jgi:hypothetical protein